LFWKVPKVISGDVVTVPLWCMPDTALH